MTGRTTYWPPQNVRHDTGAALELRANIALGLIERSVILIRHAEDPPKITDTFAQLSPSEAVKRAFSIADHFVDTATARGEIREYTADDFRAALLLNKKIEKESWKTFDD